MKGSIYSRSNNTWTIKYDLPRDSATGKRRQKYRTVRGNKRAAQRELTRILHDLDEGTYAEPTKQTVGAFLDTWLKDIKPNVRPKTHERYTEIVMKHLKPRLGDHQLKALSPMHISAAWADALANGRRNGKGGLSPQTVKHFHRTLSQALKRAVRWRLIVQNPAEAVDPPRPPRRDMAILNPDETGTLLRTIDGTALYLPVLIALMTGMRRGEILGLRWRDVDLERAVLSVTQTLEQTADKLSFQPPKTSRSRRAIDLPASLVTVLATHKKRQTEDLLARGQPDRLELVVCRTDGKPLQPRSLTKEFARTIKRHGLPRVRFHDLRHSHITFGLEAGVHPKIMSERAGHASVSITLDTYSHAVPSLQRDAARSIDALLRTAIEHKPKN